MDVSRVFQRSFKKTFKVFQKKFHVAWHSSQLPEQKEGLFPNKRYKQSFLKSEDFAREPQKWPQKPKIAGKLELIGKKGFSFRYM